ncbi:MAG: hypothetical protein KDK34_21310, partial [Leptospiraceae bacterium]|nr:hypothetical protein [Leptospiraceae bacterium]
QDIPRSRALEFLKQVLEVRGYAVLEEGDFIKVVAADVARNSIMPVEENPDANDAGIVSRVIQLPGGANINEITNIAKNIAGNNTSVVPYRPTNTLVITGYVSSVRRALSVLDELVEQMKQASPGGTVGGGESVHIYRAKHMTAESLAGVLVRLDNPQIPVTAPETAQQNGEGGEQPQQQVQPVAQQAPGGKIKAVAHKESNSIVVTASPGEWNEILSIIQTLDQPRHQILLEVLIAEVTSSSLNDFGIDWRYQGTDSAHSQFNTGLAVEGNLVDTETGQITGNNTLNGFSLGFLEKNGDLLAILNANISNQNFNVLSSPQVLTLDNQEAEINVGQDVPVRTAERTSGGGNSEATVNSFEYKPSGIKLKFTPHVNVDGQVGLDLFSEVTSIEGGQTSGSNPTFNKRNIKTFVTVQDRQTIVIGGLVFTEKLQAVRKVPFLGVIPLLGHLFRRTTYDVRRTNLMLFITPHILSNREEADRITRYKRDEQIRAERERHNEIILWPEQERPSEHEKELEIIEDELESGSASQSGADEAEDRDRGSSGNADTDARVDRNGREPESAMDGDLEDSYVDELEGN